ncbi:glycoside hydrolase family 9 protein [Salinibacterium sp. ZJ77]|uniref:glycoside hydrolase family 9 protein n=1 Tax=Salinibacterium sp. ZJ77 TaxID=2708337 RepID=UPI0014236F6D|nr:glycoside hydrolase family 9 protein [Salinibacterium sp. ZJ77]
MRHHHTRTRPATRAARHGARTAGGIAAAALAVGVIGAPAFAAPAVDDLGPELIANGTFDAGHEPWWTTPDTVADSSSGALCVDVPGGTTTAWSTIVGLDGIPLVKGESYRYSARMSGTAPVTIRVLAQQDQAPWTATYETNPTTASDMTLHQGGFTSTLDWPTGQLVFQIGGSETDWTFCLDDVSFRTGPPPEPYVAETHSSIRVNQYGYLPSSPKRATILVDSAEAAGVDWVLRDAEGGEVARGTAEPLGDDRTVASAVQRVVFDDVRATGDDFTLEAGGETSYPFSIRDGLYASLATDALGYFYLARSGIEIEAEHAGEQYARPAGHLGVDPNQGDLAVGCQQPREYYQNWTCDSVFDVSGGWYDAGDHGKYVVNGGIAVHQVLDIWERALITGSTEPLADGMLSIPEAGNGIPDILDEAQWQLDWMLRMQVPDGEQYAGMVFHKVQNDAWSGLPTMPWLDDKPRQVHRPSTAATLNFAAVTAKGSRLFAEFDPDYAARLLDASRLAWGAALATPDLYASPADGNDGGGPYDDLTVDDEFYWAAVELFLTTGESEFADFVAASPVAEISIDAEGGFDWRETAALGRMDLALVDSEHPGREAARASVVDAADSYLAAAENAFEHPYRPRDGEYDWGSNAIILNNQVILATASDITGESRYRDAVVTAMDYLLGRNGVDTSFITGYGTAYAQNQHHRWMAPSLNASLPPISPGTIAGGPNSAIQDPVAQQAWPDGCTAQLCYLDDIQSWSTNEMTINWNSALSWVTTWIALRADPGTPGGVVTAQSDGLPLGLVIPAGLVLSAMVTTVVVLVMRRRALGASVS